MAAADIAHTRDHDFLSGVCYGRGLADFIESLVDDQINQPALVAILALIDGLICDELRPTEAIKRLLDTYDKEHS